jgi:hypothetical protein
MVWWFLYNSRIVSDDDGGKMKGKFLTFAYHHGVVPEIPLDADPSFGGIPGAGDFFS